VSLLFSSLLSLGSAAWVWWLPSHLKDVDAYSGTLMIAFGAVLTMGSLAQAKGGRDRFNAYCGACAWLLAVVMTAYLLP